MEKSMQLNKYLTFCGLVVGTGIGMTLTVDAQPPGGYACFFACKSERAACVAGGGTATNCNAQYSACLADCAK
jgi:hypothetical protein